MIVPPNLDPAVSVESTIKGGKHYHCPDLISVDNHIRDLQVRIAAATNAPGNLVKQYKADIDVLLDRRSYLVLMGARLPELSS